MFSIKDFFNKCEQIVSLLRTWLHLQKKSLTLFRVEDKKTPYQFFLVTFANVGISTQNFLTISFSTFATLVKISRSYLVPVPTYWTWTKTTSQKKWFFRYNPYKIKVMVTSVIELLS